MKEKVVVVTGAGKGIGQGIALELASRGCQVFANARSIERLQGTLDLGAELGYNIKPLVFDVSKEQEVKEKVLSLPELDCLVNNAGVGVSPNFDQLTEADWDKVVNTNVKGLFFCTKYALKKMKAGSAIVNLSSGAAKTGGDFVSLPYAASKGAINSMTVSFARMLAGKGIRVNAVSPGFVDTDMLILNETITRSYYASIIPLKRLGLPKDIAQCVAFLLSEEASFMTGQIVEVNGGDIMG